jgi:hypothetical protein
LHSLRTLTTDLPIRHCSALASWTAFNDSPDRIF